MAPKAKKDDVVFSFNEVSCLVAAMQSKGVVLGNKHYELMASLDDNRTSSSFEHKFRAVKARGKELAVELGEGPGTPSAPKSAKKATPGSKKRDKPTDAINDGDGEEATPSKKPKAAKEQKPKTTKIKKEPSEEAAGVASEEADGEASNFETTYFEEALANAE
ncbi:hypothetical protein Q7P37_005811 [Cladosporium fusiforme]